MGIRENIVALREMYDITQEELAGVAGVSRGAVSQWEGGFSEPRMGAIQKIADHFGLMKSNIIEDGGMSLVDPFTKKPFGEPPFPRGAFAPAASSPAHAPLLGRVHAGDAVEPDVLEGEVSLPHEVRERHPNGYFLEVEGDCMNNVYPPGCLIYIDPDKEPQNGSIAAVEIDGHDAVMRRLYRGASTIVLSPDSTSPRYDDIVLKADEDHTVELVGTVVWYQPAREME